MIDEIVILTSSPFSKRDYDRFGVEILSREFGVRVLDCTPWIAPRTWEEHSETRHSFQGYVTVANERQFKSQIGDLSTTVVIDVLGGGAAAQSVRRETRARRGRRAILQVGLIPIAELSKWARFKALLRHERSASAALDRVKAKMRSLANPETPDIAILSGEVGLKDRGTRVPHQVWAHSFDYDIYLKLRGKSDGRAGPYAVFLDEDMVHHMDYRHLGLRPPVKEDGYYAALNCFFDLFEKVSGLSTIIAAHPRSRYDLRPRLFAGRKVEIGNTAELVRDSRVVLAHASTAISFAVLWRKPMIFLTTDELQSSFIGPNVSLRSGIFQAPLINMDEADEASVDLCTWHAIHEPSYESYIRKYIKRPGTPEIPVWEVFSEYVRQKLN